MLWFPKARDRPSESGYALGNVSIEDPPAGDSWFDKSRRRLSEESSCVGRHCGVPDDATEIACEPPGVIGR
jgi:hypothetical protein